MKKHLLMLLSWTMILLGSVSFVSCGDDDDDDKGSSSNSSSNSSVFKKYEGKSGAFIDGNDVVEVNENEIFIYHFSNDKIESATAYYSFPNETAAKAAYEEGKKENPNLKIDGSVIYESLDEEYFDDAKGFTKEQFCKYLNGDISGLDLLGNLEGLNLTIGD